MFTRVKLRKIFTTFLFFHKFRLTILKTFIVCKNVNSFNFHIFEKRSVQGIETYSVLDIDKQLQILIF